MSEVFKNFKDNEKKVTKALVHKEWDITSAMSGSHGVYVYTGKHIKGPHQFNIEDPLTGNASTEDISDIGDAPGKYSKLVYDGINHLYYQGADNPVDVFCNNDPSLSIRDINGYTSVISIPSAIFGEKIKPGTLVISGSTVHRFIDDGKGNLIDDRDTSGSAARVHETSSFLYLPFSEGYQYFSSASGDDTGKDIITGNIATSSIKIENGNGWYGAAYNVKYGAYGLRGSGTNIQFHGTMSFQPNGTIEVPHDNSFVEIQNSKGFEFPDYWGVSLYLNAPPSQSVTSSFYGPRNTDSPDMRRTLKDHGTNNIITTREWWGHNCPFELEIVNQSHVDNGKLQVNFKSKTDGNMTQLKTTVKVNDGEWHHIFVALVSGGLLLYVDGVLDTFGAYTNIGKNTRLQQNIHIGARPYSYKTKYWNDDESRWRYVKSHRNYIKPFSGSIDQLRFYDFTDYETGNEKTTPGGITNWVANVSESVDATNVVGNIFYDHGIAAITSPYYFKKYLDASPLAKTSYHNTFDDHTTSTRVKFMGTHRIKEHLYICNILDGEYNATYNPTARTNFDLRNDELQAYTTHSEFNPYITTIGLYNDNYELVAVGKLAQPVKNQDDYDNTFQVRFDTTV